MSFKENESAHMLSDNKMDRNTSIPCVLALVIFFLPWIGISCSNHMIGTESGFEMINGNISMSGPHGNQKQPKISQHYGEGMKSIIRQKPKVETKHMKYVKIRSANGSFSYIMCFTFLLVLSAAIISLMHILNFTRIYNSKYCRKLNVLILTFIAFILLFLQATAFGFPSERAFSTYLEKMKYSTKTSELKSIRISYKWGLYAELLVLIIPSAIFTKNKHNIGFHNDEIKPS